ncbi:MAG TPA: peptidase [Hungateiclostridium thermocellum]|uniref:Peptidase membrane zinc metallopeptidase n=2 Tax=Acetivibrio thermocellus TaxID=1515 RepID=A3DCX7_ACET2|nr:zinc metallopeptidase [Acetivibrio thermocellus]CDG35263.1 peptidase, membrane zinc metallopeptidase [Acetivibrio thermocellus BC1]ABN51806.1 peptidase membrane zinc metallopeptidase [Acetivibrio thermocellus ATCC 27405]ADU74724.1 peptidase membrane zinc metallopeptidase [Acetivibrio thermocellus DSM 1313]ALX08675.1 peptidase membrane zinc metallopeptidase [Acetivibrio thermocellus AD2]ANV76427.1 peptidase membrane zinc metallopeptidase [Acetivibrio thermocellus DSM 2360]
MYGIDQYYIILVLPALILSIFAQFKVKSTFNKYSRVRNTSGMTGADVARLILDRNGLSDVRIERVAGELTDHYDPRTRVIRLSQSVYGSNSVAAIGVAAHETGHAIQHSEQYGPLVLKRNLVPVANIGSCLGFPLAIAGLFFGLPFLVNLGIIFYSLAVAFYVITLPVEFNASSRAIRTLEDTGVLNYDEIDPAKKVLSAAALTYVAAAAVAIGNLLRLIMLTKRRD